MSYNKISSKDWYRILACIRVLLHTVFCIISLAIPAFASDSSLPPFTSPAQSIAQPTTQQQNDYQRYLDQQRLIEQSRELEQTPSTIQLPESTKEIQEKQKKAEEQKQNGKERKEEFKSGLKFLIKEIRLIQSTILSKKEIRKLIKDYTNKKLELSDINQLINKINNYYIDNGYITTRVYLKEQNLSTQILELVVIEGRIESISINNNKLEDRAKLFAAMPAKPGDILNLRKIEQGMDQLNSIPSTNATMKIYPGEKQGESKIAIETLPKDTFRTTVIYQNDGNPKRMDRRININLEKDNMFNLNDYTSLNYIGNRFNNTVILSNSFPMKNNTLTLTHSYSEYLSLITDTVEVFGTNLEGNYSLSRMIHRNSFSKTNISLTLDLKNATREINDFIDLPSQRLSVIRYGIKETLKLKNDTILLSSNYSYGIKAFGAISDPKNIEYDVPHSQFHKIDLNIVYFHPFFYENQNIANFKSTNYGQISRESLYNSEEIYIGSEYSVRGFLSGIYGDSGYYTSNELSFPAPMSKISYSTKSKITNNFAQIEPFIFIDSGMNKLKSDNKKNYLTSSGFGIRYNGQYLVQSITIAKSLRSSGNIPTARVVYWTIGGRV